MELQAEWKEINKLLQDSAKLVKLYPSKVREVRAINIRAARKGISAYRRAIHRGQMVRIRRSGPSSPRYEGGKRGPAQDIMPGTLWRSIKVIRPRNGSNVWLGPKSHTIFQKKGLKQINRSDAWFADIVNQGQERFGPGKNRNFGERGMRMAAAKVLPHLKRGHRFFIEKHW